jgi:hypothetical protein
MGAASLCVIDLFDDFACPAVALADATEQTAAINATGTSFEIFMLPP